MILRYLYVIMCPPLSEHNKKKWDLPLQLFGPWFRQYNLTHSKEGTIKQLLMEFEAWCGINSRSCSWLKELLLLLTVNVSDLKKTPIQLKCKTVCATGTNDPANHTASCLADELKEGKLETWGVLFGLGTMRNHLATSQITLATPWQTPYRSQQ